MEESATKEKDTKLAKLCKVLEKKEEDKIEDLKSKQENKTKEKVEKIKNEIEEDKSDEEEEESDLGTENEDDDNEEEVCCHQMVHDVPDEPPYNVCGSCERFMSPKEAILACKLCGHVKCSECITKGGN